MRVFAVTVGIAACVFGGPDTSASTYRVLYSFCKQTNCTDGQTPMTTLLAVGKRKLFGTAEYGGGQNDGVVFELSLSNSNHWQYSVVHDFCTQSNCSDGKYPLGDLIADKDGHLYGTTWEGGSVGEGTVFELTHTTNGWTETVIENFCIDLENGVCRDGQQPAAGLTYAGQATGTPWDNFSPLFGTTALGGKYDKGTVFELVSDGGLWSRTQLHDFEGGAYPGPLAMDSSGNLYGGTTDGGSHQNGLFYSLAHDTWQVKTLYNFCSQTNCTDGANVRSRPTVDAAGDIFATTTNGGSQGGGVLFELKHGASGFTYEVAYDFIDRFDQGETPWAGMVAKSASDFIGALEGSGPGQGGALTKLHQTSNGWKQSLLYAFCSQTNCTDGKYPKTLVTLDSAGNIYGTTTLGGKYAGGTIFEFTP